MNRTPEEIHQSVLLEESIDLLHLQGSALIVDATLGLGGHSEAILKRNPEVKVIGLDRDPEAMRLASNRLAQFGERFKSVHTN